MKKLSFSNQAVFDGLNYELNDFTKLMYDNAVNKLENRSNAEADAKIREVFFAVCGLDENASKKDIHKAIRKHKVDIYEVIEEFLDELIIGGWGENPFFEEFVEARYADDGDMNIFTTADQTILTVSEVSGGHHDIDQNFVLNSVRVARAA